MVYFCPHCANILLVEMGSDSSFRLYCRTCPYIFRVKEQLEQTKYFTKKKVDDVLGDGADTRQETTITCEKCGNNKAFFHQMQTRSADEPMTTFYTCTKCSHHWKD